MKRPKESKTLPSTRQVPHTAIIEVDVLARGVAVRGDFGIEDGTVSEDSM